MIALTALSVQLGVGPRKRSGVLAVVSHKRAAPDCRRATGRVTVVPAQPALRYAEVPARPPRFDGTVWREWQVAAPLRVATVLDRRGRRDGRSQ